MTSFIFSILLLFIISIFGNFETDSNDRIVYFQTILNNEPYLGMNKTYDYGDFMNHAYYNRDINYELSNKIKNIFLYKLTNFYLPFIFFYKLFFLIILTIGIMLIRYLVNLIKSKYSVKLQ